MGNCCNSSDMQDFPSDFDYKNKVLLDIFSLYASQMDSLPSDSLYTLPSPINQNNFNIFLSGLPMKISACVVPGMDFRMNNKKVCQDGYLAITHNNTLFTILCDGHGVEGHNVCEYVIKYCQKHFKKHFSQIKHDPKAAISNMLQKCDKKVINDVECEMSGTTIIVLFVCEEKIHCASLGDSRAIVGQLSDVGEQIRSRNRKHFRKITCDRPFKTIPLTQDQKPENSDEMLRIRNSGGLVEKLTDPYGRNVGPFRVWNKDGSGPGLAMSRSLGDKIGKNCGVISQPIYMEKNILPGRDQFIIIASDGCWDVLDNIEAINFVDKWKGKCVNVGSEEYPANPNNSSISRLLAEEARYRWLGVAQEERVPIDDISCVVIDFAVEYSKDSILASEGEQKLVPIESNSISSDKD